MGKHPGKSWGAEIEYRLVPSDSSLSISNRLGWPWDPEGVFRLWGRQGMPHAISLLDDRLASTARGSESDLI